MTVKITVEDNVIKANNRIIVKKISDSFSLIVQDARNNFDADNHVEFDKLMAFGIVGGMQYYYVPTLASFMDAKARFNDFISNKDEAIKLNRNFNIGMSVEEINTFIDNYNKVKARIEEVFTLPKSPYPFCTRFDLDDAATWAEELKSWVSTGKPISYSGMNLVNREQAKYNLIRLHTTPGGNQIIKPLSDRYSYHITVNQFKTIFEYATKLWANWSDKHSGRSIPDFSCRDNRVTIYAHYVTLGCQSYPRGTVEQLGLALGLEFPSATAKE